jgi:hypothetical protein
MVGQTETVGSSLSPALYKCLPARDGIKELLGSQGARRDLVQARRFPPPWDIEEHNRSCFIVRDNNRD